MCQEPIVCPTCSRPLESGNCEACGLWWVCRIELRVHPQEGVAFPPRLVLPVGWNTPALVLSLILGGLGFVTAGSSFWSLAAGYPPTPPDFAGPVLGGWVGSFTGLFVIAQCLHWLFPPWMRVRGTTLELATWNTWQGLLEMFRRVRVALPLSQLVGVGLCQGQGGWEHDTQLFLIHRSGLGMGTGWSSSFDEARRLGVILARLASSDPGSADPHPGVGTTAR